MNGSEFQEIYRYLSTLEKRIKVIEAKVESLLPLELSPELERELAEISETGGE